MAWQDVGSLDGQPVLDSDDAVPDGAGLLLPGIAGAQGDGVAGDHPRARYFTVEHRDVAPLLAETSVRDAAVGGSAAPSSLARGTRCGGRGFLRRAFRFRALGGWTVCLAASLASFAILVSSAAGSVEQAGAASAITYETRFVNPGPNGEADLTIEQYVIDRINEAQPGTRIGFAVRDWTVVAVADAVVAAAQRGVTITGVIDGGERGRGFLQQMVATVNALNPLNFVAFCGQPGGFNSCMSNVLMPGLMHNKFWLFSQLGDGSSNVVVQTSQNWVPSQRNQAQDLVRINNDSGLYDAYRTYLADLQRANTQLDLRTDNYYHVTSGDDGRNTMYPMPRRQANIWTDDTIVDRLDEVSCEPEAASGPGVVRVAQAFFRRARMAIANKLVALEKQGCDVEVLNSNGDPEIVAKLVNGGVRYDPFYPGLIGVQTHTKYWLVDATSTVTGARTKVVYAGSDNWRADEQQTDDLLLRIMNDGVYDAYASHWEGMKARSAFTRKRSPALVTDAEGPSTVITADPATDGAGSAVALRITGSDGVGDSGDNGGGATGMRRLHVEMTGAQSGSWDFPRDETGADAPAYTVALTRTLTVSAPGETTVTAYGEDHKGNVGPVDTYVVINADEGATLESSGAFPVGLDEHLAITKLSGAGTVSDGGDGTWTWRYTPADDGAGTVIVQASDGLDKRLTEELHWSAANVAPTIGDLTVAVPSGPACQGAVNRVGLSFAVSDPADQAHDPITGSIEWGDGAVGPISGRSIATSHDYAPGNYALSVSVSDGDGGTDTARTSAALRYAMTGILPPFDPDGTSAWRRGATIAVKVRIVDCEGSPVTGLAPRVATGRRAGDAPIGAITDATSTSAADTGSTMRFDPVAGQYVYDLASGSLPDAPATYFAYVREAHSLGSDSSARPTPGESSQKFALK